MKKKRKFKYRYRLLSRDDGNFDLQTRRFFIWMYIYDENNVRLFVEKKAEAVAKIKKMEKKPEKTYL